MLFANAKLPSAVSIPEDCSRSANPQGLLGHPPRRMTAMEISSPRSDGRLRRLYFGTGHWLGGFLIDRMSGSGRDCQFAASPES